MLELVPLEYHQSSAVRLDGRRIGTAWKDRSSSWRYASFDGRVRLVASNLPGIRRLLERWYAERPKAPRKAAASVPDLRGFW